MDLSVAEIHVIVNSIEIGLENKAEIPLCGAHFFQQG